MGGGLKARIPCDNSFIPRGKGIRYYNCTVSRDIKGYWLSVNIGYKLPVVIENDSKENVIGIDLGVRKRAVLSDGTIFKGPDTRKLNKRLIMQSRQYGKDRRRRLDISQRTKEKYVDIPKTKNEIKREYRYNKLRRKIIDINRSYNHKMTREIINMRPDKIVIEDLDVIGLIRDSKNRKVAGRIIESQFYEIRKMLEYKAFPYGIEIVKAPKNFASSQIWSKCGARHKQGSSEVYVCKTCGNIIDRDLNAAINLKKLV